MFDRPELLLLLILIPFMGTLFWWRSRVRAFALDRLGDPALVRRLVSAVSEPRRRMKSGLWLAALTALILALARPMWGVDADIVETRGVAVMIVLDVSASMDAQDVTPSRLERAKLTIRDMLGSGAGNLYGMVLFAGDAFVQFPLTSDTSSAVSFVTAASSASISRQGTAIADALGLALATFDERLSSAAAIVLLTDGENHEGDPLAVAAQAAALGIPIHAIGYGTPDGDLIPVYDREGNVIEFKSDRAGNLVRTQLDEPLLQEIAAATGGIYRRATNSGAEAADLITQIAQLETAVFESRFQTRSVDRFAIFVLLAVLALGAEMLLPETARHQTEVVEGTASAEAAVTAGGGNT
jgi:Ca-activated chloride channel homolog